MHQLVAPTSQYLALVEAGVAAKLAKMLVALCAGVHLDAVTNVARPTSSSTVDRLFALPNVTEAEVLSALGEVPETRSYSDRLERGVTTLSSRPVARPGTPATAVRASRLCSSVRCVRSAKLMPTAARTNVRREVTAATPSEFRKTQGAFMN